MNMIRMLRNKICGLLRNPRATSDGSTERFDFYQIEGVDDATVAAYFASTNDATRRLPLLVAAHIQAELESVLVSRAQLSGLELAEIRGGLKALSRFAHHLQCGVTEWLRSDHRAREDD